MKKSLTALAVLMAVASSVFAHGASTVSQSTIAVTSSSTASAYSGSNGGVAISAAGNTTSASTGGVTTGVGTGLGPLQAGSVTLDGGATTSSLSYAGNISLGNANGSAGAAGVGQASTVQSGEFHTTSAGLRGDAQANGETVTGTSVQAGTNQGAVVGGSAVTTFHADASGAGLDLGFVKTGDVTSHASVVATTTPQISISYGGATIGFQNEAAGNATAQAKIGNVQSQSGN